MNVAPPNGPRILSLCSGVGGLDLGVELACPGAHVVGYVERDAYAASVLLARMDDEAVEPAPVWCGDLAEPDWREWRGAVDIVTAGFPCQPWSCAGARKGTADERWIWDDIVGCIRDVGPRAVFLENVRGLVSGGGLDPVLGALADLGFDAEWGVLPASAVGAPHERARVFILAYRRGERLEGLTPREVADTRRECPNGREPVAEPRGCYETATRRIGEDVADSDCSRLAERRDRARGASAELSPAERKGDGVADADGRRLEGVGVGELLDGVRPPFGDDADGCPAELGDTDGDGRSEAQRREACDLGPFPPSPSDADGWARWLEAGGPPPALPRVRRDADGAANWLDPDLPEGAFHWMEFRNDRLRCLGNGVVPLQAAAALCSLAARFGG